MLAARCDEDSRPCGRAAVRRAAWFNNAAVARCAFTDALMSARQEKATIMMKIMTSKEKQRSAMNTPTNIELSNR